MKKSRRHSKAPVKTWKPEEICVVEHAAYSAFQSLCFQQNLPLMMIRKQNTFGCVMSVGNTPKKPVYIVLTVELEFYPTFSVNSYVFWNKMELEEFYALPTIPVYTLPIKWRTRRRDDVAEVVSYYLNRAFEIAMSRYEEKFNERPSQN